MEIDEMKVLVLMLLCRKCYKILNDNFLNEKNP